MLEGEHGRVVDRVGPRVVAGDGVRLRVVVQNDGAIRGETDVELILTVVRRNEWNAFQLEMEVPNKYNYHHGKNCGPP